MYHAVSSQPGKCGFQPVPLEQRFWEKVEKTDGCWLWNAGGLKTGYGRFWNGERHVLAHRMAYEMLRGPIPDGMELDHLCRNRACVNPAHLEPVSHAENMRRGDFYGSGWKRLTTHCTNGHPYSPENTGIRLNGTRACRVCEVIREKRREAKRARAALLPQAKGDAAEADRIREYLSKPYDGGSDNHGS